MAKELPYFKFYVSEWMLGRISDEPDKVQGAFLVAICHYWHKKCDCFVSSFSKKIGKKRFELLKNLKYIEVKNDKVSIEFLDEQFIQLSDIKIKRAKGGLARAKQMHKHKGKQKPSYIEVEGDIDKEVEEIIKMPFDDSFAPVWARWLAFRKKLGKPYKTHDGQQSALNKLAKYPKAVAVAAIEQSIESEWQGLFPGKIDMKDLWKPLDTANRANGAPLNNSGPNPYKKEAV